MIADFSCLVTWLIFMLDKEHFGAKCQNFKFITYLQRWPRFFAVTDSVQRK